VTVPEEPGATREDKGQRARLARGRYRLDVPDSPLLERVQAWILEHNAEHLHGPERVDCETDELVVLVLLRNGRPYIKPFMEHYFSLGAKHIVFLDNGSTDGTAEALAGYDNVTVLRSTLPYKRYNVAMKRYLIERFGRGRWTLSVDMDELFDYPYSDVVDLKALLGYLNDNSYTAVVSYMLDMFPERLLPEEDLPVGGEPFKEMYRFYDISDVRARSYRDIGDIGNVLANEETKILWGGVQRRLFGVGPLLTKHPLVFLDDRLRPMDLSDHWVGNAHIADFTGVLLHYKFVNGIYGQVRREIDERRDLSLNGKYDRYLEVLEKNPNLLIKDDASRELKSVNDLVGTRLMTVSRQYMRFVEGEERRNNQHPEGSRSERLLEAFFSARAEAATLAEELEMARRRKRAAEERLQAIQSSRSWKVLTALRHVKAEARGVLDRLQARILRRGAGEQTPSSERPMN
jgi:glycosyltransferase involved in cell wall biosynthesis